MHPQSFFTLKTHLQNCILLIVFTTLAYQSLSLHPKFQACEPKSCGNGPLISYPFRLPDQATYCGHPSFDLTCQDNNTILTISDDQYIIKDIFHGNHSFRVANAVAYNNSCPAPLNNVSLDRTPFNMVPGYHNLSFFYGCSSYPPNYTYPITCGGRTNDTSLSFASLGTEWLKFVYSLNSCPHLVNAPFHNTEDPYGRNYTEILRMGFMLNWTAPNCSTCASSGGRCGFEKKEFVCLCRKGQSSNSCGNVAPKRASITRIIVIILAVVFIIAIIVIFISIRIKSARARKFEEEGRENNVHAELLGVRNLPRRFTYQELKSATDNFCKKLGGGGFGTVFEGTLSDGTKLAVKRMDQRGQGRKEFLAEVKSAGRIHHINLVTLLGFCAENSHKLLVYEYMNNGSLDKWIFNTASENSLEWKSRKKVILNVAKGLAYLHEDCEMKIAHLDVKPQNILLDDKFNAKLSDFGLASLIDRDQSQVITQMRGTRGYMAPEWLSRRITEKVDVYSFGIVILEILCRRKNLDFTHQEEDGYLLLSMVKRKAEENLLIDLIDKGVKEMQQQQVEEAVKLIYVAIWCLHNDPARRPSMSMVLKVLEGVTMLEPISDFSFLTSTLVEAPADVVVVPSSPQPASTLSGPR